MSVNDPQEPAGDYLDSVGDGSDNEGAVGGAKLGSMQDTMIFKTIADANQVVSQLAKDSKPVQEQLARQRAVETPYINEQFTSFAPHNKPETESLPQVAEQTLLSPSVGHAECGAAQSDKSNRGEGESMSENGGDDPVYEAISSPQEPKYTTTGQDAIEGDLSLLMSAKSGRSRRQTIHQSIMRDLVSGKSPDQNSKDFKVSPVRTRKGGRRKLRQSLKKQQAFQSTQPLQQQSAQSNSVVDLAYYGMVDKAHETPRKRKKTGSNQPKHQQLPRNISKATLDDGPLKATILVKGTHKHHHRGRKHRQSHGVQSSAFRSLETTNTPQEIITLFTKQHHRRDKSGPKDFKGKSMALVPLNLTNTRSLVGLTNLSGEDSSRDDYHQINDAMTHLPQVLTVADQQAISRKPSILLSQKSNGILPSATPKQVTHSVSTHALLGSQKTRLMQALIDSQVVDHATDQALQQRDLPELGPKDAAGQQVHSLKRKLRSVRRKVFKSFGAVAGDLRGRGTRGSETNSSVANRKSERSPRGSARITQAALKDPRLQASHERNLKKLEELTQAQASARILKQSFEESQGLSRGKSGSNIGGGLLGEKAASLLMSLPVLPILQPSPQKSRRSIKQPSASNIAPAQGPEPIAVQSMTSQEDRSATLLNLMTRRSSVSHRSDHRNSHDVRPSLTQRRLNGVVNQKSMSPPSSTYQNPKMKTVNQNKKIRGAGAGPVSDGTEKQVNSQESSSSEGEIDSEEQALRHNASDLEMSSKFKSAKQKGRPLGGGSMPKQVFPNPPVNVHATPGADKSGKTLTEQLLENPVGRKSKLKQQVNADKGKSGQYESQQSSRRPTVLLQRHHNATTLSNVVFSPNIPSTKVRKIKKIVSKTKVTAEERCDSVEAMADLKFRLKYMSPPGGRQEVQDSHKEATSVLSGRRRISKLKLQSPQLNNEVTAVDRRDTLSGGGMSEDGPAPSEGPPHTWGTSVLPAIGTEQSAGSRSTVKLAQMMMSPVSVHKRNAQVAARSGTPPGKGMASTFSPMLAQLKNKKETDQGAVRTSAGQIVPFRKFIKGGPQHQGSEAQNFGADKNQISRNSQIIGSQASHPVPRRSNCRSSLFSRPMSTDKGHLNDRMVPGEVGKSVDERFLAKKEASQQSNAGEGGLAKKRIAKHIQSLQDMQTISGNKPSQKPQTIMSPVSVKGLRKSQKGRKAKGVKLQNSSQLQPVVHTIPNVEAEVFTFDQQQAQPDSGQGSTTLNPECIKESQIEGHIDPLAGHAKSTIQTTAPVELTKKVSTHRRLSSVTRDKKYDPPQGILTLRKLLGGERGSNQQSFRCSHHDRSMRSAGARGDSSDRSRTAFFDTTVDNQEKAIGKGNRAKLFKLNKQLAKPATYHERLEQIKQTYLTEKLPAPLVPQAINRSQSQIGPMKSMSPNPGATGRGTSTKIKQKTALKNLLYGNDLNELRHMVDDKGFYENLIKLTRQQPHLEASLLPTSLSPSKTQIALNLQSPQGTALNDSHLAHSVPFQNKSRSERTLTLATMSHPDAAPTSQMEGVSLLRELMMASLDQNAKHLLIDTNGVTADHLKGSAMASPVDPSAPQETAIERIYRIYAPGQAGQAGRTQSSPLRSRTVASASRTRSAKRQASPNKKQKRASLKGSAKGSELDIATDSAAPGQEASDEQVLPRTKTSKQLPEKSPQDQMLAKRQSDSSTTKLIVRKNSSHGVPNQSPGTASTNQLRKLVVKKPSGGSKQHQSVGANLPADEHGTAHFGSDMGPINYLSSQDGAVRQEEEGRVGSDLVGSQGGAGGPQSHMTFFNTNFYIQGNGGASGAGQEAQKTNKPGAAGIPADQIKIHQATRASDAMPGILDSNSFDEGDEGDESPRNYVKVFEVECYYDSDDEDAPVKKDAHKAAGQRRASMVHTKRRKRKGISLKSSHVTAMTSLASQAYREQPATNQSPLKKLRRHTRTQKKSLSNAQLLPLGNMGVAAMNRPAGLLTSMKHLLQSTQQSLPHASAFSAQKKH